MNYPVWYIPAVGGVIVISVVAILHVVVSHFAVGGGLWLVVTEMKAYKEKKEYILDYVKSHSKFFMLLTMVFGALTGVGIWFTITLINPDATSVLIQLFVFIWAIEWVFFLIEIVTAFLYFYTFKKISKKTHLLIGWVYFAAALASLFTINAILSFMMTPGKWLVSQNFWHAVFNPTFLSSSVLRTFLCLALAGGYALLTAAKKLKGEEKKTMVKYNGRWICYSLLGLIPSLFWYYLSIPKQAQQGITSTGVSTIMHVSFLHMVISLGLLLLLLIFLLRRKPEKLSFAGALLILFTLFVFFASFEFIREAGRKPFIINGYMYTSGIKVGLQEELHGKSFLQQAKWVRQKQVAAGNELQAGEELFRLQCYACHTTGIKNNIFGIIKNWDQGKISRSIDSLPGLTKFMPPFVGTKAEKIALSKWFFKMSHKGTNTAEEAPAATVTPPALKGEQVFENYCAACHEMDSDNALRPLLEPYPDVADIFEMLGKLDRLNEDMPAFEGTEEEKKVLADYLFKSRRKK